MSDETVPTTDVTTTAVLSTAPFPLFVTRRDDGHVLFMNDEAQALLGFTDGPPETVLGLWTDLAQRAELLATLDAEGPVEGFPTRLERADGATIEVVSTVRPLTIDGVECLVSVADADIEDGHAQDALRRSERRLRQVAESIDQGFVMASFRPFRVRYANAAYADLLGSSLEAAYADEPRLFERIDPEDRPRALASLQRMRSGMRRETVELRVMRGDELRWLRFRWSVVDDEPGVLAAVVDDVTDQRRANLELRRAHAQAEEANRSKSAFLSRVSHELRTPLNVILGFSQLLDDESLTDDQRSAVREISGAGRHLLHLVDEVLQISEADAGVLVLDEEAVALAPLVRATVDRLAPAAGRRGVEVRLRHGCDGRVLADPRALSETLGHLVENAIVHNIAGGMVEVSCAARPGDRVRIEVADTGPGLAPEDLDRVYLPFERTHGTSGAGLGLTLARRLVEAMGGELGARSVPGQGSRFWLDLAKAPAGPPTGPGSPDAGRQVLYIEDNASNAELAARALAALSDVELTVAVQGLDGLDLVAAKRFDLVLLDLHLPDIDGEEVLRRLRADPVTAEMPVVVVSADASPEVISRVRAGGADHYLTKPVSISELVRVIDREAIPRPLVPDADAPSAATGVIDPAVLAELEVLDEIEPGTLADVVELFATAGAERVRDMTAPARPRDLAVVADRAHALRGSGANLGAVVLARACQQLEAACRDEDEPAVERLVAVVDAAFTAAVRELRDLVAPS